MVLDEREARLSGDVVEMMSCCSRHYDMNKHRSGHRSADVGEHEKRGEWVGHPR